MLTEEPTPGGYLLMDWNESPLGPPPAAVERVIAAAGQLHRYPRGLMTEVTELAAAHLGVTPEHILLTAGVDEAIDITLSLAERAWGVEPGFDGYVERAAANNRPFRGIPLDADWQPAVDKVDAGAGDIVYLAQPDNPTGMLYDIDWIRRVRETAEYLFLDETYHEFSTRPSVLPAAADSAGLLVYRSFAKAMGLAGIRVGCLVAEPALIARLSPFRRFMPIDAVSLHAAAGLLSSPSFITRLKDHVLTARPLLAAALRESGLFAEVRDTEANFVMAEPMPGTGEHVLAALASERILVKECRGLGLPGWLRISVGTLADQDRLAACLATVSPTHAQRPGSA
ncbi:histidinol-phosphate transaminase [Streptomyces sodiiphilus]|uniref:Aminotransferase n=1 Tax=Streptomyces sodiiphilus TaxID=226217 RepID=A0ABN2P8L7_9ACTN